MTPDSCPRCGSDDPAVLGMECMDAVQCAPPSRNPWHDRPTDRCPTCGHPSGSTSRFFEGDSFIACTNLDHHSDVLSHDAEVETDPPARPTGADDLADRLYLDLKGARERLCRAQTFVPPHWKDDLQTALNAIDRVGSSVVPKVWSKDDQPEYPGADQ